MERERLEAWEEFGGLRAAEGALLGGLGTLLVAGLWLRVFPGLARRDALLPP